MLKGKDLSLHPRLLPKNDSEEAPCLHRQCMTTKASQWLHMSECYTWLWNVTWVSLINSGYQGKNLSRAIHVTLCTYIYILWLEIIWVSWHTDLHLISLQYTVLLITVESTHEVSVCWKKHFTALSRGHLYMENAKTNYLSWKLNLHQLQIWLENRNIFRMTGKVSNSFPMHWLLVLEQCYHPEGDTN